MEYKAPLILTSTNFLQPSRSFSWVKLEHAENIHGLVGQRFGLGLEGLVHINVNN